MLHVSWLKLFSLQHKDIPGHSVAGHRVESSPVSWRASGGAGCGDDRGETELCQSRLGPPGGNVPDCSQETAGLAEDLHPPPAVCLHHVRFSIPIFIINYFHDEIFFVAQSNSRTQCTWVKESLSHAFGTENISVLSTFSQHRTLFYLSLPPFPAFYALCNY